MDLGKAFKRYGSVVESFVHKTRSKKNDGLISRADSDFVPDGVYILHETLGVRDVEGWNPKDNEGVVGVLVVEDGHQIVVALENAPKNTYWSKENVQVNTINKSQEMAKSDFNGEAYCKNLNSPDFPAAYYCLNYKKGGLEWYLPSSGELWLIFQNLESIENALVIAGGERMTKNFYSWYLSSSESNLECVWGFDVVYFNLYGNRKVAHERGGVRPVSKFKSSELKESFIKKVSSKKSIDLVPDLHYPDGVYIFHRTLGVKTVEEWNKKLNNGVVGILLIEDDHKIVVATEDAPEDLHWSKERGLINQPVYELEDAESDFNGEYYCQKLNSPNYPAAYYCKTYNKGNRDWYLPSSGELWMIYRHLDEIQNALSIVGGQKFITTFDDDVPVYWS